MCIVLSQKKKKLYNAYLIVTWKMTVYERGSGGRSRIWDLSDEASLSAKW